jgi:hypothetical protein
MGFPSTRSASARPLAGLGTRARYLWNLGRLGSEDAETLARGRHWEFDQPGRRSRPLIPYFIKTYFTRSCSAQRCGPELQPHLCH